MKIPGQDSENISHTIKLRKHAKLRFHLPGSKVKAIIAIGQRSHYSICVHSIAPGVILKIFHTHAQGTSMRRYKVKPSVTLLQGQGHSERSHVQNLLGPLSDSENISHMST